MQINKLVFGGLILMCVAAAGGGAYLATRHNTQTTAAPASPAPTADAPAAQAVTSSEGVLSAPPAAAPAAAEPPLLSTAPALAPAQTPAPRRAQPAPAAPASRRQAPLSQRQASTRPAPATEPVLAPVQPSASGGTMWESRPAVQPAVPEQQPAPAPEPVAPPAPEFLELIVPTDAVIGLQMESTVSSDRAKVEDAVDARVTRDVRVSGRVAIPAGSLVYGTVTEVERGGKMRERARLGIRFHTVVLAGGERLTLRTEAITREGAAPGRESAAKIGGAAVGGAILGAILGGKRGAAIGGAVGAGGGTAAVMAGESNAVTVPAGSTVSVRIQQPVAVTVEKE